MLRCQILFFLIVLILTEQVFVEGSLFFIDDLLIKAILCNFILDLLELTVGFLGLVLLLLLSVLLALPQSLVMEVDISFQAHSGYALFLSLAHLYILDLKLLQL